MPTRRFCLCFLSLFIVLGCGDDAPKTATFVEPVFEDQCLDFDCMGQGECVAGDAATGPSCACEVGYSGAHCASCESGFHRDFESRCVPDKTCADQSPNPCGIHGDCRDTDGVIACACAVGYEGPRCRSCASGYAPDKAGECLQKVISNGQTTTVPAVCAATTCSNHGQCRDQDRILTCECYPGYVGPSCDLCDSGYNRPSGVDQCVPTLTCDAATCGGCVVFDGGSGYPDHPDGCTSTRELDVEGLVLWSLGGDGTTWLCSTSNRYALSSDHVALEAGALQPAELTFEQPIVSLSFEYAPWDDAPFEVLGDGESVSMINGKRYVKDMVKIEFEEPVSVVGLRSQDDFSHTIAVDNIVYSRGAASCN